MYRILLAVLAALTLAVPAAAQTIGLKGLDPVSYHQGSSPVTGRSDLTAEHLGQTYQFATVENREAFLREPTAYLPQFGGHCAWAASQGYKAPGDPHAFAVVDGKLYLQYNRRILDRWSRDRSRRIILGHQNWPRLSAD